LGILFESPYGLIGDGIRGRSWRSRRIRIPVSKRCCGY